jgi:hypothetical protein
MARPKVKLDLGGLEEVAKSREVRAAVHNAAERVADAVKDQGITVGDKDGGSHEYALPVKVYDDTTDGMRVNRATSRVVLAHAAGLAVQAKHGALSKAASAAGLKLKGE